MDIVIIGGGASAMMLAAMIEKKNIKLHKGIAELFPAPINVTILEKNKKLGKKLLITGNGKCNFTSGGFNDLYKIYNSEFAINIYKNHDENECLDFYKHIGIYPKMEIHRGIKYYYPNSNKATSVYYNLLDKIITNGVNILYEADVYKAYKDKNRFIVEYSDNKKIEADILIIATGGKTYKNTGSDGFGYELAKSFNHTIVKPIPGLTSLISSDSDIKNLNGVRFDATIKDIDTMISESGEIQLTKHGISGIPCLNISRYINRKISNGSKVRLSIDFMIDKKYISDRRKVLFYKKQSDFLCGVLPDELSYVIMKRSKATFDSLVADMSDDVYANVLKNLSDFIVNIDSYSGFDEAQVTLGGVNTDEVDNVTLESKKFKNLYFLGEVLDIDGRCGGYNLQLAYSTASSVFGGIFCNQI